MLYFLLTPIITYNLLLIAAAVIPAFVLIIKVYQSDRLEHESGSLILNLIGCGILAAILALVEERLLMMVLDSYVAKGSPMYNIILFFVIVAVSEESSKYLFMRRKTWKNREFNCQYDGVVYAVVASLGFALWENISYTYKFGFSTAIMRSVTAIPGHACFGVFMGIFYGIAKKYDYRGNSPASFFFRLLAIAVPALIHGAYDYIATSANQNTSYIFVGFIAVLFIISYILVGLNSRSDHYIDQPDYRVK